MRHQSGPRALLSSSLQTHTAGLGERRQPIAAAVRTDDEDEEPLRSQLRLQTRPRPSKVSCRAVPKSCGVLIGRDVGVMRTAKFLSLVRRPIASAERTADRIDHAHTRGTTNLRSELFQLKDCRR